MNTTSEGYDILIRYAVKVPVTCGFCHKAYMEADTFDTLVSTINKAIETAREDPMDKYRDPTGG